MVTNGTETTTAWRNQLYGIPASFTTAQQFGTSNSYGVALGDLDGDGDLDAFFANYQQPNTVWSNFSIPPNNCTLADFDFSGEVNGADLCLLRYSIRSQVLNLSGPTSTTTESSGRRISNCS